MTDQPWDNWEPVEYLNEIGQSRWQPRAGKETLWHDGVAIFKGEWRAYRDGKPKLYRRPVRAARIGKRRYRKNRGSSWTRQVSDKEEMDKAAERDAERAMYASPPLPPLPPQSGWITQADHGEESWK